jgi:two-component system LytT family response regulator
LNSQIFLRVHRSAIVNKNHITELKSRKNGDYDGVLTNGQSVRFSRHYRQNWSELLNH